MCLVLCTCTSILFSTISLLRFATSVRESCVSNPGQLLTYFTLAILLLSILIGVQLHQCSFIKDSILAGKEEIRSCTLFPPDWPTIQRRPWSCLFLALRFCLLGVPVEEWRDGGGGGGGGHRLRGQVVVQILLPVLNKGTITSDPKYQLIVLHVLLPVLNKGTVTCHPICQLIVLHDKFTNDWPHRNRFYYIQDCSNHMYFAVSYTVTRRSAEFRHPARMAQDSSCWVGENDCFSEVFRNHRKFPAIFTMKKGRMRMVGSNSVPMDY
jgi:hypothetical protein